MSFFVGEEKTKTREDEKMVELEELPFLDIYWKNQHGRFLVHGHSSWCTFDLHLVRGPNAL